MHDVHPPAVDRLLFYYERMKALKELFGVDITIPLEEQHFSNLDAESQWLVKDDGALLSEGPVTFDKHTMMSAFGPKATIFLAKGVQLKNCRIISRGRHNFIYVGANCKLKNLTLEAKGRYSALMIGYGTTWEDGSCVVGGEDTSILIGDDCQIATQVVVRTEDGHGIFDRKTQTMTNQARSVSIGAHVWIGRGSTISKGSDIGLGTVIAAGSLARGKMLPHALYAGTPVELKRTEVTWSRSFAWNDIPEAYR